ncbi:hypothetical protein PV11_08749 [Exophiala sideris]|uniref:Uncharacterized protein n=1 Tax=Exophiala sideris TaxID=1016849 RepID=A0A0D1Y7T0_9EURO|nr:hypothetical protein PV11_08749 [Exophiala sideris]
MRDDRDALTVATSDAEIEEEYSILRLTLLHYTGHTGDRLTRQSGRSGLPPRFMQQMLLKHSRTDQWLFPCLRTVQQMVLRDNKQLRHPMYSWGHLTALAAKVQRLPDEPAMPPTPCSRDNPHVWPEDHWPAYMYPIGTVRPKVFPGCQCKTCGLAHPTSLHEHCYGKLGMLYEAFRCKEPAAGGHLASGCGLGEWRDLPDNRPLPEAYMVYERPWVKESKFVPYPRFYYYPGSHEKDDLSWPNLPDEFAKGLPYGLVDITTGLKYSLEMLVSARNMTLVPMFDAEIHKPYHPRGFPLPATEEESLGKEGLDQHATPTQPQSYRDKATSALRSAILTGRSFLTSTRSSDSTRDEGNPRSAHGEQ